MEGHTYYNSQKRIQQRSRVETDTDFATQVPDTHYPMGTQVLIRVNLVSDNLTSTAGQPTSTFFAYFVREIMMNYASTCILNKIVGPKYYIVTVIMMDVR